MWITPRPTSSKTETGASAPDLFWTLSTLTFEYLDCKLEQDYFFVTICPGVDNMSATSVSSLPLPVPDPEFTTPPSAVPMETETLSENVFRRIQAAIINGEIAPGSKISEPELARTYGISRGPLREAIHRLEGQRLLVRIPHVGARVVSLNHAELIELYEIRESLEGMACRLAAERMSQAQIDELREVLATHERDAAFQAGVGYYQQEGDFDFHYRIIQGSGNSTLVQMLCDDLYQLVRMYRIQFSATPNRPHQAFAEHHRILDAIAERDGELAELLMRRHIAASKRNVERHYLEPNQNNTPGAPS